MSKNKKHGCRRAKFHFNISCTMNKFNEKSGEKLSPEQKVMSNSEEIGQGNSVEQNKSNEVQRDNPETPKKKSKKSVSINQLEKKMNHLFEFRLNSISNRIYYRDKIFKTDWAEVNENDIFRILHKNGVPASISAVKLLLGSSFVTRYNPLHTYFNDRKDVYDPKKHGDYISQFLDYCEVDDPELFSTTFKFWMVNAVRTVFKDKAYNKVIYVFFNTKQNSGKTSLARFIMPDEIREYFMENQLDTTKDGLLTLTKCMIHLLDEMAVTSIMGFQAFKAIVSKDKVDVRPPYGLNIVSRPRITSFLGTSDKFGFLNEDVGTARFIVQEIKSIDFKYSKNIDPNILWSQAFYHYLRGEFLEISPAIKQKIAESNKRFIQNSYLTECISELMKPSIKENGIFMQSKDIVKLISSQMGNSNVSDRKIGDSLNSLGFYRIKHYCNQRKESFYGYYVELSTREADA